MAILETLVVVSESAYLGTENIPNADLCFVPMMMMTNPVTIYLFATLYITMIFASIHRQIIRFLQELLFGIPSSTFDLATDVVFECTRRQPFAVVKLPQVGNYSVINQPASENEIGRVPHFLLETGPTNLADAFGERFFRFALARIVCSVDFRHHDSLPSSSSCPRRFSHLATKCPGNSQSFKV
eukprot:scaffold4905_cov98-Cylindrotheca_fusiformis.AAC.5